MATKHSITRKAFGTGQKVEKKEPEMVKKQDESGQHVRNNKNFFMLEIRN